MRQSHQSHRSRQRRSSRVAGLLALLAALTLALTALAGCGGPSAANGEASQGQQNQQNQNTPGPTPGPMIPTATPIHPTPIATWNGQCATRALPQGWTWYQDARYPFRVAAPPTWRSGSFEYIPDGSGALSSPSRIHVVDFFGPGSVGKATSSGVMRNDTFPPVITIEVDVGSGASPPNFGTGQLANWRAQSTPVCIGAIAATLYISSNSEGDVGRAAVLRAGPQGHACVFTVASRAATAARDGQLFATLLATYSATAG